jgi:hypothetical protein
MEWISLSYQIASLILLALFLLSFSIAREPRGWRRLFQSSFSSSSDFSVNKNKVIDENIKKYGIIISMILLMAFVGTFVWGLTERSRKIMHDMSPEDQQRLMEYQSHMNSGPTVIGQ